MKHLEYYVRNEAIALVAQLRGKSRKHLFIDMGSNLGQGFKYFSRFYSPEYFDYWLFEPQIECLSILAQNISFLSSRNNWSPSSFSIFGKAISNSNGIVDMYGIDNRLGSYNQRASIKSIHNSRYYNLNQFGKRKVETLDISDLIHSAKTRYSSIVCKIDIEGSEYDVLERLITSDQINEIDHMYVEWHSHYMDITHEATHKDRELFIKTNSLKCRIYDWI